MKHKKIKILIAFILFVALSITVYSEFLDNDVEVEPESNLTYYIDVNYDGIDVQGVKSSDDVVASVTSEYIYVEDKLPQGLTFQGFVTTDNGRIGAVKRSDGSTCTGYVIDDTKEEDTTKATCNSNGDCYYHGLHYTKSDNTVRFKVDKLQAGCVLTVGIVTKTPTVDDPSTQVVEDRRDFYNVARVTEGPVTYLSNVVHVYMGSKNVNTYMVEYKYTGTIPDNVPPVPNGLMYTENAVVSVANNPVLEGYDFSGWTTTDTTVNNNTFNMPNKKVTFTGSFTEKQKYNVKYSIEGTVPTGYVVPSEKQYYEGQTINVDSLKYGDTFNGYLFLGWTTNDASINDYKFIMPNKTVTLTGKFEFIKYKVQYRFYNTILPPNSDNYLPSDEIYSPGETVKLKEINNPANYEFLGWYHEDNFKMPDDNVIIYGEWKYVAGKFSPKISQKIVDDKSFYRNNSEIIFKIKVKNTAGYDLTDVRLEEKLNGCVFIKGEGYSLIDDKHVSIKRISANGEHYVYARYIAGPERYKKYTNVAVLTAATGAANTEIDKTKDYSSEKSFVVINPLKTVNNGYIFRIVKVDENSKELNGSAFTLYKDAKLKEMISSGLQFGKLEKNTTYYLKETTVPVGYKGLSDILTVSVDNNGKINITGYDVNNDDSISIVKIVNEKIIKEENPKTDEKINDPEPTPEPKSQINKISNEPKKSDINIKKIISFAAPSTGICFIFFIIILKKKKRTIMIYAPDTDLSNIITDLNKIDYDNINDEKIKVVVLAGGNLIDNNYNNTILYELTKDGYKEVNKQENIMNEKELIKYFNEFTKEKYKAKKYDFIFLNKKISNINKEDSIDINIFKSACDNMKYEIILFRVGDNIKLANELFNITDVVSTPDVDYNVYSIDKFLNNINYINHRDKGENIGNKFKENNNNYIVITKK